MEVPVINRIRDFEVGINSINDPTFLSRSVAVSGIGKLHQAYGFWKWGALIIAFLAYFTNFISRLKSLVIRLRKLDVSISTPPLFDDYDTDSDVSCSSTVSSDDEEEQEDVDEDDDEDSVFSQKWVNACFRVRGSDYYDNNNNVEDDQGQNGNFTSRGGSFGDLFTWPDLGGIGSSGVVKLWDHLDIDGDDDDDDDDHHENVVTSFLRKSCFTSSSPVVLAAEKKGLDGVKVKACDPRAGFRMPALLAEWRQPGKLLGNIIGVDAGGVEKIYVRDDVNGKVAVGDLRRFNGALTDLTESDAEIWWDADVVITADEKMH